LRRALERSGPARRSPPDHQGRSESIFEKRIDGFGEAFRRLSWDDFGPRAILTRATAGVFNGCVIFSLPGSPNAVRLGVSKLVLPVLEHAVELAQGRTTHRATLV
jgi:molybdenum cofactor biosynthesis protein B